MTRKVTFSTKSQEDLAYWKKVGDSKIKKRISDLLHSIQENPFEGIGKPEPLKHQLSGSWSRRINREHGLVYRVSDEMIMVESLRGHY